MCQSMISNNRQSFSGITHSHSQDLNYKEMEEELTCPVCLELYADPLMLPCSHSICKTCLHDIMTSRAKAGKQDLECPSCRQNHYLTSDQVIKLPKNLALENIVFRYQEIRSCSLTRAAQFDSPVGSAVTPTSTVTSDMCIENSDAFEESVEKVYCGMCEEPGGRQAEWFCQQCQVLYCQLCLDIYHPKRGALSKHRIRKPTLKESVKCMLHCPDHNAESASIFCDTCKVVACHLCVCQGLGLHCHHVILDLETARRQLQEALQVAKNELSTLLTSFSDRNNVIDSRIQDVKDIEDSAKGIISSQYNCILSDIAATLNLVKQKSLESIGAIANQHSSHFAAQTHQIKTVLWQCQHLGAACDNLLSTEENSNTVNKSPHPHVQHLQSFSEISHACDPKSLASTSSTDDISDSNIVSETNSSSKSTFSASSVKQSDPATLSAKSHSHEVQVNTVPLEVNLASHDQKTSSNKIKDVPAVKNRSAFDSKDHRRSSFFSEKLRQTKDLTYSIRIKEQCGEEKPLMCNAEKFESFDHVRKSSVDQKNLERKLSRVPSFKAKEKSHASHLRENDKHHNNMLISTREGGALNTQATTTLQNSTKDKTKPEDQLLLRAVEVGPVLKQVAALIKENESREMENEGTVTPISVDDRNILTCVSDFHTSCLELLSNITGHLPSDFPVIIPAVRSVVTPANLGQSTLPRVQSRTLITWGFNSTTFTADPLEGCAQWSVNVNRNMNHIGDIKTGYLFGIGVSTKPLSSKEQVGMTAESHAISCIGGQLVVCQDSVHNIVMPLTDLPICTTIAVAVSKFGLVMAYKVMMNGISSAICGQRVIALDGDKFASDSENKNSELKVYPVFTVSQRVKLQFPTSSSV